MNRTVTILGMPMDLGQSRRGVDMGPSGMRCAGLNETVRSLGYRVRDLGDLSVPVLESLMGCEGEAAGGMAFLDPIAGVCRDAIAALGAVPAAEFPIVLGGDHSIALGSIPGVCRGVRTGVVWIDAHTDFNIPETSPSGNIHGMPLAALLGRGDPRLVELGQACGPIRCEDVIIVGARSVDPGERDLLRTLGVTVFSMKEIDRLTIARVADEVIARLRGLSRVHVSLDADALDPSYAPGVGTPVPGGLTYREAHMMMELLHDAGIVTSLDLVEVNPVLDRANATAAIMVELAASLLGRAIL